MSYLVTSYCSIYGCGDTVIVENIDDIYNFIIAYVIYPSCIYKNNNFSLEDIPSLEYIEKLINDKDYINDSLNFTFGAKEVLIYKGNHLNNTYYVTVKNLNEIEKINFDENTKNLYRNMINDYIKKLI